LNPDTLGSAKRAFAMKNPANITGANANWSIAIEIRTRAALGVVYLKRIDPIVGRSLQYHPWSIGAKYPAPTKNKLVFLFQSTLSFLSTTNVYHKKKYLFAL